MSGQQNSVDQTSQSYIQSAYIFDAEAIAVGRRFMIEWSDLATAATTLPNLEEEGRDLIEQRLGYLPNDRIIIPFEPYLRGLLHSYRQGQMAEDEFHRQVKDHLKLIRNADMQHNLCLAYDADIYQNYDETFVPYGYAVKSRLTKFLGYEPKLEHSLIAEMWLRDVMANDAFKLPDTITQFDLKVITLIKYREVLLKHGKAAADTSLLLRLESE